MSLWLKTIGVADDWIGDDWYEGVHRSQFGCPKDGRPTIDKGDRVLIYATGHQRVVAAVEVTSSPRDDGGATFGERWPWVIEFEPLLIVPRIDRAPSLDRVGVGSLSVRNNSHIHLTEIQYRAGVAGLAEAASLADEPYAALAG